MIQRLVLLTILLVVWAGLIFASLQINRLELGHSLCGDWGCGPPAAAVLSMHAVWLSAILPPFLVLSRCSPLPWKTVGMTAFAVGLIGMAIIGILDFIAVREYYDRGLVWQRYLFRLAELVDWPVVQILITGGLVTIFGKQRQCCSFNNADPKTATHNF